MEIFCVSPTLWRRFEGSKEFSLDGHEPDTVGRPPFGLGDGLGKKSESKLHGLPVSYYSGSILASVAPSKEASRGIFVSGLLSE